MQSRRCCLLIFWMRLAAPCPSCGFSNADIFRKAYKSLSCCYIVAEGFQVSFRQTGPHFFVHTQPGLQVETRNPLCILHIPVQISVYRDKCTSVYVGRVKCCCCWGGGVSCDWLILSSTASAWKRDRPLLTILICSC